MNRKIARRYTTALYELGSELNSLPAFQKDFTLIKETINASKELRQFLASPVIKSAKKNDVLQEIFKSKIGEIPLKLISILSDKSRENYLYDISVDFENLINEKKGIAKVNIKTAVEISEKEKDNLTESLKKRMKMELIPSFEIDKEIKGGFIAQVNDTIIDASIRHQLDLLRKQFTDGSYNN